MKTKVQVAMYAGLILLSVGLIGWGRDVESEENVRHDHTTATLTLICTNGSGGCRNEFLVLDANSRSISWKFFNRCSGKLTKKGTSNGNAEGLSSCMKRLIAVDEPRLTANEESNFSILFQSKNETKVIASLDDTQKKLLTNDAALKDLFEDLRKKIFGKKYDLPDVWKKPTQTSTLK